MRNYQYLVYLLSLALAGIILIQGYWVYTAIKLREEQFSNDMADVLTSIARRLDSQERYNLIIENLSTSLPYAYGRQNTAGDIISLEELEPVQDLNITLRGNKEFADYISDSASISENLEGRIRTLDKKIVRVDSMINQVMLNGLFDERKLEDRIQKEHLDSLIQTELEIRNIDLLYEFAVYENQELSGIKSEAFDYNKAQFKTLLFRNNVLAPPTWLYLYFPKKNKYLIGNVISLLSITLVLISIVIIAFLYTVKLLQKQKNISMIKTDFINNMTHEFKTPIATIGLAVDALSNERVINNPEKILKYSRMIKEENIRMNAQVEQVLRLAMLDKNQFQLTPTQESLGQLVEKAINSIQLQLENRGGNYTFINEAEGDDTLLLDRQHMVNVVINLLDNAMKYSSEEPKIDLRIYREAAGNLALSVSDNGIGMSKEVQKKVFDRFYRQSSGDIHNIKGHGLGLSYVMEILKLQNAEIHVDSTLGKGSVFTISFASTNDFQVNQKTKNYNL